MAAGCPHGPPSTLSLAALPRVLLGVAVRPLEMVDAVGHAQPPRLHRIHKHAVQRCAAPRVLCARIGTTLEQHLDAACLGAGPVPGRAGAGRQGSETRAAL